MLADKAGIAKKLNTTRVTLHILLRRTRISLDESVNIFLVATLISFAPKTREITDSIVRYKFSINIEEILITRLIS